MPVPCLPSHPLPQPQMSLRTVEELVGGSDDEWHKLPRWRRIPSLEAGGAGGIFHALAVAAPLHC